MSSRPKATTVLSRTMRTTARSTPPVEQRVERRASAPAHGRSTRTSVTGGVDVDEHVGAGRPPG